MALKIYTFIPKEHQKDISPKEHAFQYQENNLNINNEVQIFFWKITIKLFCNKKLPTKYIEKLNILQLSDQTTELSPWNKLKQKLATDNIIEAARDSVSSKDMVCRRNKEFSVWKWHTFSIKAINIYHTKYNIITS